jgi:hypothetical protein
MNKPQMKLIVDIGVLFIIAGITAFVLIHFHPPGIYGFLIVFPFLLSLFITMRNWNKPTTETTKDNEKNKGK